MKKLYLLTIAFFLASFFVSYGQLDNSAAQTVHLRSGSFIPSNTDAKSVPSQADFFVSKNKKQYGYVQFTNPLSVSDIAKLNAEGVEIIDYIRLILQLLQGKFHCMRRQSLVLFL